MDTAQQHLCTASTCSAAITGLTDGVRRDVQVRAVSTRAGAWSPTVRGTPGADQQRAVLRRRGTYDSLGIEENASSGANVGSAVAARDAEADTFTYSLAGTDEALFEIDASTGQLRTANNFVPDFEGARNTYDVTVSVTDGKADDGTAEHGHRRRHRRHHRRHQRRRGRRTITLPMSQPRVGTSSSERA